MSGSMNKVILIGRAGKDPEERRLNSGDPVVSFSLATSENWKDKATGERKEKTEWHNIVIFNDNIGRIVMQYVKKGSLLYIEGALQTRKWQDKDSGADRYTTEIVLQKYRGEMTLLGSKGGSDASNDDFASSGGGEQRSYKKVASGGGGGNSDLDDEIPF